MHVELLIGNPNNNELPPNKALLTPVIKLDILVGFVSWV